MARRNLPVRILQMISQTAALLVIDVQRIYTDPESALYCAGSDSTVEHINSLMDAFTTAELPIFLVRHIHARDGSDLGRMFDYAGANADFNFKQDSVEVEYTPSLKRPPAALQILKHRYSAFQGTDLQEQLQRLNVGRVVICGFMTSFCCESTAREAHDRDYFVTFVTDATGSPALPNMSQQQIREAVDGFLGAGFATIVNCSDYLQLTLKNETRL
jgi:nicotinamidase-related amidase